jgi:hypothetical protein
LAAIVALCARENAARAVNTCRACTAVGTSAACTSAAACKRIADRLCDVFIVEAAARARVAVGIQWRRHDHKGNKQGLRCAGAQLGVADNERE